VWVLNVSGSVDLLHAVYQGQFGVHLDPSSLGASFFIPTVVVPALLTLHPLMFWVLFRSRS